MIESVNLCKNYADQNVLNSINISLNKGEIVGLIGVNGSGKTTLLDILALINLSSGGDIIIDNEIVDNLNKKRLRSKISYVPQDIALFEELTVKENLICWSKLNKEKTMERIMEIEPFFNLQEMFNKKITKLSGGMKKRINIAVALMGEYDYMILDEPLAGVDYENAKMIIDFLVMEKNRGIGILITGHELNLLNEYTDRIIKLEEING